MSSLFAANNKTRKVARAKFHNQWKKSTPEFSDVFEKIAYSNAFSVFLSWLEKYQN